MFDHANWISLSLCTSCSSLPLFSNGQRLLLISPNAYIRHPLQPVLNPCILPTDVGMVRRQCSFPLSGQMHPSCQVEFANRPRVQSSGFRLVRMYMESSRRGSVCSQRCLDCMRCMTFLNNSRRTAARKIPLLRELRWQSMGEEFLPCRLLS